MIHFSLSQLVQLSMNIYLFFQSLSLSIYLSTYWQLSSHPHCNVLTRTLKHQFKLPFLYTVAIATSVTTNKWSPVCLAKNAQWWFWLPVDMLNLPATISAEHFDFRAVTLVKQKRKKNDSNAMVNFPGGSECLMFFDSFLSFFYSHLDLSFG